MNNGSDDLPPNGSPDEQDVLRSIGDIGPRYAQALRQIGVHTPADLAQYTPEQLAHELNEKAGVRVTPDRIRAKDWIGQAQKLMRELAQEPAEDQAQSQIAQGEAEVEVGNRTSAEDASWRERGMFTIRFIEGNNPRGGQKWQIRVYHEGGTGPEMPFDGLDPNPWVQWIFEQMQLPPEPLEPVESVSSLQQQDHVEAPEMVGEVSTLEPALPMSFSLDSSMLEMEDVGVSFDEVDVNAWPPAPKRFLVVEARFRFQGEHARELAQERTPYLLEFYLIDQVSQASNLIGSNRGNMEPNRDEYELRQNFAMPAPGLYELQTILLLPNQNTKAFRDGPAFHVVEEKPRSSV